MPTRIYLIRHGATRLTEEDRFAGSTDVELSVEGRSQIANLTERLAEVSFGAIYASPLLRTVETARMLAAPHGLQPTCEVGLREIDYGRWEGLKRIEVQRDFEDEYETWQKDPVYVAPMDGESGSSVIARILPVIRRIVGMHRDQNVMLVAHKATNRLLVCSLLGLDPQGYRIRLDQSPAALNILDFVDGQPPRLVLYNDISHCLFGGVPVIERRRER